MTTERKEPCPECATPTPLFEEAFLMEPGQAPHSNYDVYGCPSCGHSWAVAGDLALAQPNTASEPLTY